MMLDISLKINFEEVAYWPVSTILKTPLYYLHPGSLHFQNQLF